MILLLTPGALLHPQRRVRLKVHLYEGMRVLKSPLCQTSPSHSCAFCSLWCVPQCHCRGDTRFVLLSPCQARLHRALLPLQELFCTAGHERKGCSLVGCVGEDADNLEGSLALIPATKQMLHGWAVAIRDPAWRIRTAHGKMCVVLCLEPIPLVRVVMYGPHPALKCVAGVVNMQKCFAWGRVQAL